MSSKSNHSLKEMLHLNNQFISNQCFTSINLSLICFTEMPVTWKARILHVLDIFLELEFVLKLNSYNK